MHAVSAGQSYVIEERLEKALKTIRSALTDVELEVAGEFDVTVLLNGAMGPPARSKILLVDCPLLTFEATALDRAAAVFFPLHLLISGDSERTRVCVTNPMELFDTRVPLGAAEPMDRLLARVTMALEAVRMRSDARRSN